LTSLFAAVIALLPHLLKRPHPWFHNLHHAGTWVLEDFYLVDRAHDHILVPDHNGNSPRAAEMEDRMRFRALIMAVVPLTPLKQVDELAHLHVNHSYVIEAAARGRWWRSKMVLKNG
jgi:hypothetical protein